MDTLDWSCLSCCAFNKHSYTQSVINTNVGSNRARTNLCFKKNGRQFSNKDFPRGQVNGFPDKLGLEKIKTRDRLKNNTADPSHFYKDSPPKASAHLAHAIAAQTHRDTKAMARAKFPTHRKPVRTAKK